MAGISFAAPQAPATDAPPPQAVVSHKGRAFASTMADATRAPAKPVDGKDQRPASKDKDAKAGKDDRQDGASPAPAVNGGPVPVHQQGAARADAGKPDDKSPPSGAGAAPSAKTAGRPEGAEPAAIDTRETAVDAAQLAPVLDALKQAASASLQAPVETTKAAPSPEPPAAPPDAAADPQPGTASLLAARVVPAHVQAEAKPAAAPKKNARAEAAVGKAASIDAAAVVTTDQQISAAPDASAIAQPDAGQQLAAGGADRALDMAKQGAWLDGLSRDIAATGDSSSTLRFQAAPEHLGGVQVEIARGLEGASVTLTASSETSRIALADARPQLIAEARAQGLHIASAQVDVSTDSRQPGNGNHADQRHEPRGQTGLSSQTGGNGGSNGNQQTRSQPFAVNQPSDGRPVAPAETDDSASTSAPAGGMYA
ncbi:MAG TPA: flagellar hook-length control protein FliK [Sphingomonas sp.]